MTEKLFQPHHHISSISTTPRIPGGCVDCDWLRAEIDRLMKYLGTRWYPLSIREGLADPDKAYDEAERFVAALQAERDKARSRLEEVTKERDFAKSRLAEADIGWKKDWVRLEGARDGLSIFADMGNWGFYNSRVVQWKAQRAPWGLAEEYLEATHEGLKCPPGESAVGTAQQAKQGPEGGRPSGPDSRGDITPWAGTGGQAGREPSPMPEALPFDDGDLLEAFDLSRSTWDNVVSNGCSWDAAWQHARQQFIETLSLDSVASPESGEG